MMQMDLHKRWIWGAMICGMLAGCEGRPTLVPYSDPNLNRTSTQFAADAVRRFPYPTTAPAAGFASGRAEINLTFGWLQILNSSDEDWKDVDLWVNKSFVCHIPLIPKGKEKVETVTFSMLYNDQGHFFSTNDGNTPVKTVEIAKGGKRYALQTSLAD